MSLLMLALACSATPRAGAAVNAEEFVRFSSEGTGAGQTGAVSGIATDPVTGAVYVTDASNRIDKFTPWGEFVMAWGWGVSNGASELQTCTSSCQAGLSGSGPGQFDAPLGIAVDSSGNVYVKDSSNNRVEKFGPTGAFLLMFGGEVNATSGADICTKANLEAGDQCGAGASGTGPGEFSGGFSGGEAVTAGPGGAIFVADVGRIQEFEPNGSFKAELKVAAFENLIVKSIAVDPLDGDVYAVIKDPLSLQFNEPNVLKLDPAGALLDELEVERPRSVVTDSDGNAYVIALEQQAPHESPARVLEFDTAGAQVASLASPEVIPGNSNEIRFVLTAIGTNTVGDLYVANGFSGSGRFIRAFGPAPTQYEPPPSVPPTIGSQFVASATPTSAVLKAQINPHFWSDTTYFVEYGPASCASNPCTQVPVSPGTALGAGAVSRLVVTAGPELTGLSPKTTYHYRFVATSGGGGPVFGPDATFTTFPPSQPPPSCANDAFRTGLSSAPLPDCRAYEMVSPVDKENGDILALIDVTGFENRLNQSSADGNSLTYSSYRAFANPQAAPYTSQYLARRGTSGWESESLEAPRGPSFYTIGGAAENQFKAFGADLCAAWLVRDSGPTLAAGAIEGFPNLYRRENCPAGYAALSTSEPPSLEASEYVPEVQGHSADGAKAVFRVNDKLTANATAGKYQVYEASGGALSLVCILPGETPFGGDCSAGTPPPEEASFLNRTAGVSNAMSEDGSVIYWSASTASTKPGTIYARVGGSETREVSKTQTTKPARFWGASADGSKALFEVEDPGEPPTAKNRDLYLYDLAGTTSSLVARKVIGVAAASEDLGRVYLVSEEVLGGTSGATAGKANLYLHEASGDTFIATLSSVDVRTPGGGFGGVPSNVAPQLIYHAARANPDGSRLAFISTNPLTGADNTDAESGAADSEVFTYAVAGGGLACASCSPVGARPLGRQISAPAGDELATAASIPVGENQLYQPRALSDDGSRLFFTSYTDLLPGDDNGKADVYEWERAGTAPSCAQGEADPDYYAANGGCLFLISGGSGEEDSELVDSSPSGKDVFFSTEESLLSQDPALIDIYDARAEGGFPAAPAEPTPCNPEGGACQTPPPPPGFAPPGSAAPGEGNPPLKKPIKCPKGKHRVTKKGGKESCAKNKAKKKSKGKKRAHKSRRAGK